MNTDRGDMINNGAVGTIVAHANTYVEEVAKVAKEMDPSASRAGGTLSFADFRTNRQYAQFVIGTPDDAKKRAYHFFSIEKIFRGHLFRQPNSFVAERNTDEQQYGGAVKIWANWDVWISFSGFPELLDIAFCVFLLHKCKFIGFTRVEEIFSLHRNAEADLMALYKRIEAAA